MSATVVRIGKVGTHPKADHLKITCVNGRSTIFPEGQFQPGDLAVYVDVGSVVPCDRAEFMWLSKKPWHRVRKAYIRKIPSYGFLIPYVPTDGPEGSDVSELLGLRMPFKAQVKLVTKGWSILGFLKRLFG